MPTSAQIVEELKRKIRPLLRRRGPKGNFRVNGLLQLPSSLLLNLRSQTGLQVSWCPPSSSFLKTGVLGPPRKSGLRPTLLKP